MKPTIQTENYTLYHADCLDVLPTLAAGSIDAVITDPPYGIGHRRGKSTNRGKGFAKGSTLIIGDDTPFCPAPLLSFPAVLLWGANWYSENLPAGRWLIWDKQEHGGSGDFSEAEIAWTNKGKAIKFFRHMWLGVQRASQVGESPRHPTEKPVALMEWCIDILKLPKGSTIFDPYMGSSSVGVAAARKGMRYIGCEIAREHFTPAAARIANAYGDYTPTPAEKASPQLSLLEALK